MYKTSKFSNKVNQELEIRVLDVLAHSEDALTIQQIQQADLTLIPYTSQKMSRVLGYLSDMGFVKKAKDRAAKRMVYKAVSVMLAQGYEVEDVNKNEEIAVEVHRIMPAGTNWELAAERELNVL